MATAVFLSFDDNRYQMYRDILFNVHVNDWLSLHGIFAVDLFAALLISS